MATVKITVRPNGPYRVEAPEGSIELVDVNGNQYDLTGKPAFSLCRCGGFYQQTVLRRDSQQDRIPGSGTGGEEGRGLDLNPGRVSVWSSSSATCNPSANTDPACTAS